MSFDRADLAFLLATMAVPAVLLLVVALVRLGLRRRLARGMRQVGEAAAGEADAAAAARRPDDVPLPLRWLGRADAALVEGGAAAALDRARRARRAADRAFAIAGGLFGVLLSGIAVAWLVPGSLPDRLVFGHVFGVAPLLVTLAFVSLSWTGRLAIVAAYLLAGPLLLAPHAGGWARTVTVAAIWSPMVLLFLPCLLLFTVRRLRPLLLLLAALFVFMVLTTLAWFPLLMWLHPRAGEAQVLASVRGQPWWAWTAGAAGFLLGGVLLQQFVSRVHRARPRAALLGIAAAWVVAGVALVNGPLNAHPAALLLAGAVVGPVAGLLQWFVVWLIFRLLLAIQERRLVTPRVLHFHLCCAALAVFVAAPLHSSKEATAALLCGAAFGLEVLVLHGLLRRAWSRMPRTAARRLLLLRVFGQADRRETLLDWLDAGWRHVGRVDLIAGTDLAMRTLSSRMLEALLLRRVDAQYLQTADDVGRRLGRLHDDLEGDLHYPVNEVYCYENTWRAAVGRLALDAHAVLMDLRGFSRANQGCVFELEFLSREVSADRVLLLADDTTDAAAVSQTLRRRAGTTPAGAAIAIMTVARHSRAARDALNRELCRIAFDDEGHPACVDASFASR